MTLSDQIMDLRIKAERVRRSPHSAEDVILLLDDLAFLMMTLAARTEPDRSVPETAKAILPGALNDQT